MVSMRNLGYFIKEAFVNFRRNLSTGMGAIITIFLSLLIIGVFAMMNIMINAIAESVEEKVNITAYIADDASDADVKATIGYVEGLEYVESVSFTTKDQALENFKNSMESNMDIVEQLDGENPLPASIDINLSDPQQVETVANQLIAYDTFKTICDNPDDPSESVKYGQESVERLFSVTNIIRYVGLGMVLLLILVTLFFINNTIRLAILARQREISIMRLVGATKGFIRGPFVTESIIQAIIGTILAVGCLALIDIFLMPFLVGFISWLPVEITWFQFLIVSLGLLVIGLIIGLFGSALAMRKHLKV
ncbi:MAG: permease-like cell division protein FtsX [Coriobacteriales bacterium]|nr:permease-like cell division protein FtsX [Coriobacteriales bacterium]